MNDTFFNPPEKYLNRIVPTEHNPETNVFVKGYVHDPNTRLLNGVAGHAGLFSTAGDLAKYCSWILKKGVVNGNRIIESSTVELFTKRNSDVKNSSRALGWDTAFCPEMQNKSMSYSAGSCDDINAFGHTGFTGTSIWISFRHNLYAVILTNRVCPSRDHTDIEVYRKQINVISSFLWKHFIKDK